MMVILEGAVLSTLFNAIAEEIKKGFEKAKPPEVQKIVVKQDPNNFTVTEIDKVTTANQKWTNKDNPILEFENPLEKETLVKEISLIPDDIFSTKGKLIITIDDSRVFKSKSFTAFEDISESIIKINKTIQKDSKVKFFMISSDGSTVGLTAQVTFGE